MARVRRAGSTDLPPRPPEGTSLGALLRARRFRLGAGTARVAENLARHGGEVGDDAAPWIGVTRPPAEAPSVALGPHPGTLGPRSFGFLNNVGRVAALDGPVPALPRPGGLALVATTRDALPDPIPLLLLHQLGLSFLVSVGEGDPAEAIAFLNADPATRALAVVLGPGARGAALRPVLGAKPTALLGGDELCRAVALRSGAAVCDRLDEWLAQAALYDAGLDGRGPVHVLCVGGGLAHVRAELAAAGLAAEVHAVDDRDPAPLDEALAAARAAGAGAIVVASTAVGLPRSAEADEAPPLVLADLRHPGWLRALAQALARGPAPPPRPPRPAAAVDAELLGRVKQEVEAELGDHDAKRLLKAYGARVTRQAPTATPTGALKLAKAIGLPVVLTTGGEERLAETQPDVRRLATLLLEAQASDPRAVPSLLVRERFPDVPRTRARLVLEQGLGVVLRVGDASALVPLGAGEALRLAQATPARRAADQRAVADLLETIARCAEHEDALFDLELYVGADPAVLRATGVLRSRLPSPPNQPPPL